MVEIPVELCPTEIKRIDEWMLPFPAISLATTVLRFSLLRCGLRARSRQRPDAGLSSACISMTNAEQCIPKLETLTGDSVIIVNAIHLFFPGHTWA